MDLSSPGANYSPDLPNGNGKREKNELHQEKFTKRNHDTQNGTNTAIVLISNNEITSEKLTSDETCIRCVEDESKDLVIKGLSATHEDHSGGLAAVSIVNKNILQENIFY